MVFKRPSSISRFLICICMHSVLCDLGKLGELNISFMPPEPSTHCAHRDRPVRLASVGSPWLLASRFATEVTGRKSEWEESKGIHVFPQLLPCLVVARIVSCQRLQLLSRVLSIQLPIPSSDKVSLYLPLLPCKWSHFPADANLGCCRILWCFSNLVTQLKCVICFPPGF